LKNYTQQIEDFNLLCILTPLKISIRTADEIFTGRNLQTKSIFFVNIYVSIYITKGVKMIVLKINETTNSSILQLWIEYYTKNNILFIIYTKNISILSDYLIDKVSNLDWYKSYITDDENVLYNEKNWIITEYDFLFSYTKNDEKETMDLSMLTNTDIENEHCVIGRVFYVPIPGKKEYTTFEIPDFILYQHSNHTNYTVDGLQQITSYRFEMSNRIVCLCLKPSSVAMNTEYYENNILFENTFCNTVYINYSDNIYVNKEKKYGIIWHPKCACSTITHYFCDMNNIKIVDPHTLNDIMIKYRYNNYLQKINIVSFVRHPFTRFLSCYFNKHIDKYDNEYLQLKTYNDYLNKYNNQDTLWNFIDYLQYGNIIDTHSLPIYQMFYFIKYKSVYLWTFNLSPLSEKETMMNDKNDIDLVFSMPKVKYEIFHIEDDLNNYLKTFFSKYHTTTKNTNNILNFTIKNEENDTCIINKDFKYYNYEEWIEYKNNNNNYPNYLQILDEEIKEKLSIIYKNDLHFYSNNINILYNNSTNNLKHYFDKLPEDFDVSIYKELNRDLTNITDIEAKLHYTQYGMNENRNYKVDITKLPEDFDVSIYKELNRDLTNITDIEAKLHYIQYGMNENRNYKVDMTKLPEDFDVSVYKEYNRDLIYLSNIEAKLHYIQYGMNENRTYKDNYFCKKFFDTKYNNDNENNSYLNYIQDIRQEKNSYFVDYVNNTEVLPNKKYIFLVNHDNKLYGASHYLYLLFLYFKKIFINNNDIQILLCEFDYNIEIFNKYLINKNDILEYHGDPTLLYMLYEKFQPKVVYLNSCNFAIYKIYKYIPENIRILHSHEIFNHYLLSKEIVPNYVVSNQISNQYLNYHKKTSQVQPPFLISLKETIKISEETIEEIKNNYKVLDKNKMTIGMCGQITERKNYKLFIEVSKHFLHYNFVWIGDNTPNVFDNYENIFHIKSTQNPYKYYKQIIDYFILFSKEDPCPYVILENILLETNIIVFDKNILYTHTDKLLKNMYFSYDGEINLINCIDAIHTFVKGKKNNTTNNGYNYIKTYFNKPYLIENKIKEILCQ
jgi:hypothetical protein